MAGEKVKMMPLIKLNCDCDEAVSEVIDNLHGCGLRAMISFDSRLTREMATPVVCPHHGTAVCDCRIVILLIYETDSRPATLLAHGQDGETWISLVIAPGQRPSAPLENKIRQALSPLPAANAGAA